MTIELSLRRRAKNARYLATLWIVLATLLLLGTYLSLPLIAGKTLDAVSAIDSRRTIPESASNASAGNETDLPIYALTILGLSIVSIGFASYLLGRNALIETEIASRFNGIADALCICGNDLGQLERAATIFIPKSRYLPNPEAFTSKEVRKITELLKTLS